MSDELDPKLGFLCDKTNFRLCRLSGFIENHACIYAGLPGDGEPKILDLISFLLAVVIFFFYVLFVSTYKKFEVKFQNQKPTRGTLYYKTHIVFFGISVLCWGIEQSVIPIDGSALHFVLTLRYVFLNAGEVLLLFITLVDSYVIPANTVMTWVGIGVSSLVGLLSFLMMIESAAPALIPVFGIGIPFGCALFNFFAMVSVCIMRKLYNAIGVAFGMLITNAGPLVCELFLNGPLCGVSVGWFTGSALGILIFAFYRVTSSVFYNMLKRNEIVDGMGNEKKLLNRGGEDNSDIPAIIDIDDYPYDYTYSEISEDPM